MTTTKCWASLATRTFSRSRRPTESWPGSFTPTSTAPTRSAKRSSKRPPRPTRCSATPRSAVSTTPTGTTVCVAAPGGTGFDGFGGFGDIFQNIFDTFGGFGGASPFGRAQPAGPAPGEDVAVDVELTLEEAAFGVEKEVSFRAHGACSACEGAGTTDPASVKSCPDCGGTGQIRTVRRTMLGQMVQTAVCLRCQGRGQVIGSPCEECHGAGRTVMERKVSVQIPAGIDSGQRIRVSGRGGAGERGARAGDLYVRVRVAEHELFTRQGDDLLYHANLTMTQAALGVTLTIPTLDGEEEVTFAAGTQPGEVKTLRGKGVPHLNGHGRGDQELLVNVLVPRDLDDEQKRLLQEFERELRRRAVRPARRRSAAQAPQLAERLSRSAP